MLSSSAAGSEVRAATERASSLRAVAGRPLLRQPALPILVVLAGYPAWALLGLTQVVWLAAGVPMAVTLMAARRVRVPRGFGLWVAFVVWAALSTVQLLDRPGSLLAHSYRLAMYTAAGVLLLYVFNLSPRMLPTDLVLRLAAVPLAVLTVGGLAGFVLGEAELLSLPLALLPRGLRAGFLTDLLSPRFAQVQVFLGFDLPRPAFPFRFSNQWGSVMAALLPMTMGGLARQRSRHRPLVIGVIAVAFVPIIVSVNRGLWLSLAVMLAYVALRHAISGRIGPAVRLVAGVLVVVLLVAVTPLGGLVADRAESSHSNRARSTLYSLAFEQAQESPVVGFGAPRVDVENPDLPPVGSHGQLWTVLFSQGFVGTALFLGFLIMLVWQTGRDLPAGSVWLHAAVVSLLVQMWVYNFFPGTMTFGFLTAGLLLRDRRVAARRTLAAA